MATLKRRQRGPNVIQMAGNLARHSAQIARSGFTLASPEIVAVRRSICGRCDLWDGAARAGLGKCNHPKCGCCRAKHVFAASRCPMGKW